MVESSKILTVSYGTFSCTLEGFDDSFSTMKAIAEYFRDLAAGDRYFGAEPPTPDADMLTRIAEREISRRVDVTSSDTGIVLRASEPAPQPAVAAPEPVKPAPVAAESDATVTDAKPAPEADDPPAMDVEAEADLAEPESDTAEAEPTMPPVQRPPEGRDAVRNRARAEAEDADVSADSVEAAAPRPRAVQAPAHPDANSVAAKLQRIRAVVGGVAPAPAATFAEDLEDEQPDEVAITPQPSAPMPATKEDVDVAEAETQPQQDFDAADEPEAAPTAEVLSDADTNEAIDRASADFEAPEDDTDTVESETDAAEVAPVETEAFDDETDDQIDTVLRNLQRAGLRQNKTADVADDVATEPARAEAAPAAASADAAPEAQPVAAPTAAPIEPPASRGRILRVTRRAITSVSATVETATAPPTPETPAPETSTVAEPAVDDAAAEQVASHDDDHWPRDPALETEEAEAPEEAQDTESVAKLDGADDLTEFENAATGSTLSPEDEADLQRELAEVSEDGSDDTDPDAAAANAVDTARRDPLPGTSEAEMSRIMSQADEELANPEGNRRRSAIAHLKAAVAATEAARQLGEPASARAEQENTFRSDLDQVVRPRRAERPAQGTERARPAPLKLVASQRIDVAPDQSDTPVQPRRVAKADNPESADIGNFAEFAEAMGATGLQDLLEAAAAYAAFVEGSEDFSRPHIMEKVRQTVTEDFSREDGLRSFGTLLRQGRIERVRNGRFAVSERTRFRPEATATGS